MQIVFFSFFCWVRTWKMTVVTKETKSLMYQSYFSCGCNYLVELSAYGNRLGNKCCVTHTKQCFISHLMFERLAIIRADPQSMV